MTSDDVRRLIRRACVKAGGQKAWAVQIGVTPAFITDILKGHREPSPAILKPLGLERVTVYRRKQRDK